MSKKLIYVFQNYFAFLLLILIFTFQCCSRKTNINESSAESQFYIKSIEPTVPKLGDKLKIILNESSGSFIYSSGILFNDLWSITDSVKGDTVYSFMPYLPQTKNVNVKLQLSVNNKIVDVQKTIELSEIYEKGISIINNDEQALNEQDIYPLFPMDPNARWNITINQDTVLLNIQGIVGDESNKILQIKFLNNTLNRLPKLIDYVQIFNDSNGSNRFVYTDTLLNGIIKIDKWNINGIYSGIIYAELNPIDSKIYFPPKTIFWIKR
ncbi:MAG: hypothetical protein M1480_01945 [Bacteroidetes bacterium]|nr:hypothetical protein [Bacteroidota bacterium]